MPSRVGNVDVDIFFIPVLRQAVFKMKSFDKF